MEATTYAWGVVSIGLTITEEGACMTPTMKTNGGRVALAVNTITETTTAQRRRRAQMSKMKEWLLDRQENGDDGTEYPNLVQCDLCGEYYEHEEEGDNA